MYQHKISIVYQDSNILIINKPSGLLTHPRNENDKRPSVASWLAEHHPGAVWAHRLDKDTSGILLIAKNTVAHEYYKKLFHDRLITKKYIALVYGSLKNSSGIIDTPLFKFGTRQSLKPPREGKTLERQAQTEYKVLQNYTLATNHYALLEISPRTGRTHQIRIHLRSIGHPIVCDPIYAEKSRICPPSLGRVFLHAKSLSFTTPEGRAMTIETDLPEELDNFLKSL